MEAKIEETKCPKCNLPAPVVVLGEGAHATIPRIGFHDREDPVRRGVRVSCLGSYLPVSP